MLPADDRSVIGQQHLEVQEQGSWLAQVGVGCPWQELTAKSLLVHGCQEMVVTVTGRLLDHGVVVRGHLRQGKHWGYPPPPIRSLLPAGTCTLLAPVEVP